MNDSTITRYEDVETEDIPRDLRFHPSDPNRAQTLSYEQVEAYNHDGYVKGNAHIQQRRDRRYTRIF